MPEKMTGHRATVEYYVSNFAGRNVSGTGSSPAWLEEIRKDAIELFADVGFPSSKEEKWRFTNFSQLATRALASVDGQEKRDGLRVPDTASVGWWSDERVVFVDGKFSHELSSLEGLPDGVVVGNLADVISEDSNALQTGFARVADTRDSPFTALNTAFFSEGGILLVPRGMHVESPIQLLYLTSDGRGESVTHPRNLVIVGENAQATLVERHVGMENVSTWTNAVTEIALGDAARLAFNRVQQEGGSSFHTATTECHLGRDSNLGLSTVDIGASLSRHDINIRLNGTGASCSIRGLVHLQSKQHADNQTAIVHSAPHCNSVEQFNGIFDDSSHGVFTGRVLVEQDAQKTDAMQSSRNLLLSDRARADTQPQLEIFADDVKCTHGATVGPIDDDALFYLRSKGISSDEARTMLTYGFASEILESIGVESLRHHLELLLSARLAGAKKESRGES